MKDRDFGIGMNWGRNWGLQLSLAGVGREFPSVLMCVHGDGDAWVCDVVCDGVQLVFLSFMGWVLLCVLMRAKVWVEGKSMSAVTVVQLCGCSYLWCMFLLSLLLLHLVFVE